MTPIDWNEECALVRMSADKVLEYDRGGRLADLVAFTASRPDKQRSAYTLKSRALGRLDAQYVEALKARPDFPGR